MATCEYCDGTGFVTVPGHAYACNGHKCASDCPIPVEVQCSSCAGGDTDIACGFCGNLGCDSGDRCPATEAAF